MFGKDSKDKKDSSTKATKKSNIDFTDIRTKLGLTEHAPEDKIAFELNKLKDNFSPKIKIKESIINPPINDKFRVWLKILIL